MASTPCGIDTSVEAIKNAQGDLDALFGPGAKDKFAEIETKANTLGEKLDAKLPQLEQNPSLQKLLSSLQGKTPLEALTTMSEIQNDFGPLVSDLDEILGEVSPDLQSISKDVQSVFGSGGGAIGDLQSSLSAGEFSTLLSKASAISDINTDNICNNCKNLEIQTFPDGTKAAVELPKEPKVPDTAPTVEIPPVTMSGSDAFKSSILFGRKQQYNSSHRPFNKYFNYTVNEIKKTLIDNEWSTASYNSSSYGTIQTKDLKEVDTSIDPFDPDNASKLNGLTPEQYKNTQGLKLYYIKKFRIISRQWILDKHEIANAFEEIVPYAEYYELAESIISQDEIDEGDQVKFNKTSGFGSIHTLRDHTKELYDIVDNKNPSAYLSFNYYIYNKVRVENGLGVDAVL